MNFIIPNSYNTITLFCQGQARFLITVYFAFTAHLNSVRLNTVTNCFLRRLLARRFTNQSNCHPAIPDYGTDGITVRLNRHWFRHSQRRGYVLVAFD